MWRKWQDIRAVVMVDPSNVPLTPKGAVSVTLKGHNSKVITKGTVTYKVFANGKYVHGATDPLCDFGVCPVKVGSGSHTINFNLPWWLPNGKYTGYAVIRDQDGDLALCNKGFTTVQGTPPCPCPNCPPKGEGACCHWTQPGPAPASACETQNWSKKTCTPAYGTWCPAR